MNLATFFEHWGIVENPFRGEEARQDPVFLRLGAAGGDGAAADGAAAGRTRTTHSDFEKIAGDFERPSTSIVFGEKGSGKTAIRIELAQRVAAHDAAHPDRRCLLVAYDDLNPFLDRFHERFAGERKATPLEVLKRFRLADHMDAILSLVVTGMVNELFRENGAAETIDLGGEPRRAARRLDPGLRRDLLLLQALYDQHDDAEARTRRLRRLLRLPSPRSLLLWGLPAMWGWIVPAAFIAWALFFMPRGAGAGSWTIPNVTAGVLAGAWVAVLLKYLLWDRLGLLRTGHRVRRQVRVSARGDRSYAHALREIAASTRDVSKLPVTASDEARYAMLDRLRRVLRAFGYVSMVVVIDRVDEPTIISGDPERMQAVVWPLLSNKFLQQPGVGVKMLLPIELRHALFRESAAFFQEARLDKQNLIERLTWTGAMLYDLCNARLRACRGGGAEELALVDMFAEDTTLQDVVDALDQMHQPRDAFKMLYQCFMEHCSNVTESQAERGGPGGGWRIPRGVLEHVRKDQAERVRQLYRGVRPA